MSGMVSFVVPAHNEESYLPACIESIGRASRGIAGDVEVVVVANRCTDRTAMIAVVPRDAKRGWWRRG